MKTTLDILLILYKVISTSSQLTQAITGEIYKQHRPIDSEKEDVVIDCDSISDSQIQTCKPSVKIHVPNKPIFIDGIQDLSQPDTQRLNELAKMVWSLVEEKYVDNYWFYAIDQRIEKQEQEHFVNITIDFNILN